MIASERRFAGAPQFRERARRIARADLAELADQRADEIVPPLRHQHAERGEIAGKLRHDDARDRNLARNGGGVRGPAPPKAISVVSRGSIPLSTEIARTASDIAPSAMVVMPSAAATLSRPTACPIRATAASAGARASFMWPPRKRSALRRPSTRSASVTVGAAPPRP